MTSDQAEELKAFYRRYIDRCNAHHFEDLAEFVAEDVHVNGEPQGLDGYIAGLRAVVEAFPDYHWDLRHLLLDGDWLAAHFIDTGTHSAAFRGAAPTGRRVQTQEFAMYRIANRTIVEVWGAANNAALTTGEL